MSRCYVGNLPPDHSESSLLEFFEAAGKVIDIQIKKTISNDSYAFVHYSDSNSAEAAVRKFDGVDFMGSRLRVELPFPARRPGPRRPNGYVPPATGPRVAVRISGIPESGSWQDLKDHFREAGDCVYADTYGDGTGVVEYSSYEDARRAIRMFDNSTFRSHQGETGRLELEIAPPGRSDGNYRDRGRAHDSPYRRESGRSHYSRGDYRDDRGSYREYGPIRGERYYGKGDDMRRDRSPPARRGYGSRRSPPPYRGGPPPYDDDRYTTQDSRSTEAFSTRSIGREREDRPVDDNYRRPSPGRGKGNSEGSWSAGQPVRDIRGENEAN